MQGTAPSDSSSLFWVDLRGIAYVQAGPTAATLQLLIPGIRFQSPPVTVPANATVAVPLEAYSHAWAGQWAAELSPKRISSQRATAEFRRELGA